MNNKKRLHWSNNLQISSVIFLVFVFTILIQAVSCVDENSVKSELPFPSEKNPWMEIRKERIHTLLPQAMKIAGVDSWVVICRENNNDPLANHVGGENAGGTVAFLFNRNEDVFESVAITPLGEATALKEMGLHDRYILIERGSDVWQLIKEELVRADPEKIAINSSQLNIADGLSFTQKTALEEAVGPELAGRFVSSENLIMEWLSVKLPEEIEIMSKAALLTEQLQIEAYQKYYTRKNKRF